MGWRLWIALVLFGSALVGCLGPQEQGATQAAGDPSGAPTAEGPTNGNATNTTGQSTPTTGDGPGSTTAQTECAGARANVTEAIQGHHEDPFGDRPQAKPHVRACGSKGVFSLAAYGLDRPDLVSMQWTLPRETTCSSVVGAGVTDSHHPYYVERWSPPGGEGSISAGFGSGGLAVTAFAGPARTDELGGEPGGATAWGGGFTNETVSEGRLELSLASPAWGPWNTSLTDGAALRVLLACEDPLVFQGFSSPDTLALFESRDQDAGAGAHGPLVTGAMGGRALDTQLADGGSLVAIGYAFQGAGVLQIDTPASTTQHPFTPDRTAEIDRSIEAGSVTVGLAEAGSGLIVAGAAFGPLQPISASSLVASANGTAT